MEVNGQYHVPTALPPGREPQSRCGGFYRRQNSLVCVGILTPDLPVRSLIATETTVPNLFPLPFRGVTVEWTSAHRRVSTVTKQIEAPPPQKKRHVKNGTRKTGLIQEHKQEYMQVLVQLFCEGCHFPPPPPPKKTVR